VYGIGDRMNLVGQSGLVTGPLSVFHSEKTARLSDSERAMLMGGASAKTCR
jgi:hypothetical protein